MTATISKTAEPSKPSKTLRCRMMLVAAACILGTLAVAGLSLTVTFERQMLRMIGNDLDVRLEELARNLTLAPDGQPQVPPTLADQRYLTPQSGAYWQISENGKPILLSPSLGGQPLDLNGAKDRIDGKWFEIETGDDDELYVVEREITLGAADAERRVRVAVALDHDQVAAARSAFELDAAQVLGLIALVLVFAAWLQLRVIGQPLGRLGAELEAIRNGSQARFQSALPGEVAPLAEDLNRLLDRQEQLVQKARERAGALAHGLKTPLAILAAEARRIEGEGQGDAARRLQDQISAIQTHVERELARARTRGASAALGAYVDAARTAERLVRVMALMPRGESLRWRCEAADDLMLRMDPDDFGEVLGNLLDNARKWAANRVTVRCALDGDQARVVVEDDGPGFGANASPTRLTAGDRESSAGLGLVIVQDVLADYGSSLWIDRAAPHGIVSFVLPGKLVWETGFAPAATRRASAAEAAPDGRPGLRTQPLPAPAVAPN